MNCDHLEPKAHPELVAAYRRALADAIRRPMGVIPDSASGLITGEELEEAEARRQEQQASVRRINGIPEMPVPPLSVEEGLVLAAGRFAQR